MICNITTPCQTGVVVVGDDNVIIRQIGTPVTTRGTGVELYGSTVSCYIGATLRKYTSSNRTMYAHWCSKYYDGNPCYYNCDTMCDQRDTFAVLTKLK
jgi:hypothetical protein